MRKNKNKILIAFLSIILFSASLNYSHAENTDNSKNVDSISDSDDNAELKQNNEDKIIYVNSVEADGESLNKTTSTLLIQLSSAIDLSIEDIKISNDVTLSKLNKNEQGIYEAIIEGNWDNGDILEVTISKQNYTIESSKNKVVVYKERIDETLFGENLEENSINNEESDDVSINNRSIITSQWGSAPITFDEETGVLTVSAGELISNTYSYFLDNNGIISRDKVVKIILEEGVVAPKQSGFLFSGYNAAFDNLQVIEGKLDVSKVENAYNFFGSAAALTYVDVSEWNTSHIYRMDGMFSNTRSLENIDVSNWDTSSVTTMQSMFSSNFKLKNIDVSKWDTSSVKSMNSMFYRNTSLESINVSEWKTGNVTSMSWMFLENTNLSNIDVSKWDVSSVTTMDQMFVNNVKLEYIDVSNWDVSSVINMSSMFSNTSLVNIDVSKWDTSSVVTMNHLFNENRKLEFIDVSKWDTSSVTTMSHMFRNNEVLESIDVSKWDISHVTNMYSMFENTGIREIDLTNWNTSSVTAMNAMFKNTRLEKIILGDQSILNDSVNLSYIPTESKEYTGKWERIVPATPDSIYSSSYNFMNEYDGSKPGTYVWQKTPIYNIEYNLNGGTNNPINPSTYYEGYGVASFSNPTREGYSFIGWRDNNGDIITNISNSMTGDVELNAIWELQISYISAVANGIENEQTSTKLVLTFSQEVPNFTINSIELSNPSINKTSLTYIGNGTYELNISGTWNEGDSLNINILEDTLDSDITITPIVRTTVLHKAPAFVIYAEKAVLGKLQAEQLLISQDYVNTNNVVAVIFGTHTTTNTSVRSGKIELSAGIYDMSYEVDADPNYFVDTTIEVVNEDIAKFLNDYAIAGNNIVITTKQAASITAQDLETLTGVRAWNNETLANEDIELVSHNVESTEGVYDVTYKVKGVDLEITLKVQVVPEDKVEYNSNYAIAGNNIILTTKEAETITTQELGALTGVHAWDKETLGNAEIEFVSHNVITAGGYYEAIFKVKNNSLQIVLEVQVVPNDVVEYDKDYAIAGNNITITKSQATSKTAEFLKDETEVYAWNRDSKASVNVEYVSDTILSEVGEYTVTFKAEGTDVEITLNVSVIDEDYTITADSIVVKLEDVSSLTSNDILTRSGAIGHNTTLDKPVNAVVVDDTSILEQVGTYPVTIGLSEGTLTKVIYVYVVDENIVLEDDTYVLVANNTIITSKQASNKTEQFLKDKTQVRAWNKNTGAPVNISYDGDTVVETPGIYDVTFSVEGTSLVVNPSVQVIAEDVVEYDKDYTIAGNNIVITTKQAETITSEDLKAWTGVRGWDGADDSELSVSLVNHTVLPIPSNYVAIFKVDGTNVTISLNVQVIAEEVLVTDKDYAIAGNNIIITTKKAATITAQELETLTGVRAWDKETLGSAAVEFVSHNVEATVGTYEVTFKVADTDLEITLNVQVVLDDVVVTDKDYAIAGNNIIITTKQAETITAQDLETLTGVRAWDKETLGSATVEFVSHNVEATVGTYEVTFKVADTDLEITLNVQVVPEDVAGYNSEYAISGNNIIITTKQAETITAQELETLTEVHAWDKETLENAEIEFVSHNIIAAGGYYEVIFKVKNSSLQIVLEVQVVPNDVVEYDKDYAIAGNNITITKSQATSKTAEFLKDETEVYAWNRDSKASVNVEYVSDTILSEVGEYTVTFKVEGTDLAITLKVNVIDEDYTITADSIVVKLEDVSSLTSNDILTRSGAIGHNTTLDKPVNAVVVDDTSILEQVGTYPVTIGLSEGTLTKVIYVYVVDENIVLEDDTYVLVANNTIITSKQASNKTEQFLKDKTQVRAWNKNTGAPVNISYDGDTVVETPGIYDVTFSVEGTSLVANPSVQVVPEDGVEYDKDYAIVGNNIVITTKQAASITAQELETLTEVHAWDRETLGSATVEFVSHNVEASVGTYEVTFKVVDTDLEITLNVQVVPEDVVVTDKDYAITGNNIVITTKQAATITDQELETLTGVRAWDRETLGSATVEFVSHNVEATVGTYEVIFKVEDTDLEITLNVQVVSEEVVVTDKDYAIAGNNIVITTKQAETITSQELKTLTGVRAWDRETLGSATVEFVSHNVEATVGTYEVTFKVADTDLEITLNVQVVSEEVVVTDKDYAIAGNNIVITTKQAATITSQELKTLTGVRAWDRETLGSATVEFVSHNVEATVGTYEVTFKVADTDLEITLNVQVVPEDVVNVKDYIIAGNNIVITQTQAANINSSQLKNLTKVRAWNKETLASATVEFVSQNIKPIIGNYEVIFKVQGTSIEIVLNVQVIADEILDNEYTLNAESFVINIKDVASLDNNAILNKSNAQGYNLTLDEEVGVSVLNAPIENKVGKYKVTLQLVEGDTEKEIYVYVVDEDIIVNKGEYVIVANNSTITVDEAKKQTDTFLKNKTAVKAWNKETGDALEVEVLDNKVIAIVGEYEVTFRGIVNSQNRATEDIDITIVIKVIPDTEIVEDEYEISGNNFAITVNEAKTLTKEDILKKSNAQGWNVTTNSKADVEVVENKIVAKEGTYPVDLEITDTNVNTQVYAYVVNKDILIESGSIAIAANNARISVDKARNISDGYLKEITQVTAWNLVTGEPLKVEVVEHTVTDKVGVYSATFKISNTNERIKVSIEVYDNNTEVEETTGKKPTDNTKDKLPNTGVSNSMTSIYLLMSGCIVTLVSLIKKKKDMLNNK